MTLIRRWLATVLVLALSVPSLSMLAVSTISASDKITDQRDVVQQYTAALSQYNAGNWSAAASAFAELIRKYPTSPNSDLFLLRHANAVYQQGNLTDAEQLAKQLASNYPSSPLRPYALLVSADCAYQARALNRAVEYYVRAAVDVHADQLVQDRAIRSLAALLDSNTLSQWSVELLGTAPPVRRCQLAVELSARLRDQGLLAAADSLSANCADERQASGSDRSAHPLRCAVLLPLSGQLKSFGDELIRGLALGAAILETDSVKIILDLFDTRGDALTAGQLAQQLRGASYRSIIGPLTSAEASVVAAAAAQSAPLLPFIVPAAVEGRFGRLHPRAYQLSPSLEQQASVAADYAYHAGKKRTAVVIAAEDQINQLQGRAFSSSFTRLGGTIEASLTITSRDRDFGAIIADLKQLIAGRSGDSVTFLSTTGDTLQQASKPVDVGALYIAATPGLLRQLLPQLSFYNLVGLRLGTSDWSDESVLRLEANVLEGAVVPFGVAADSSTLGLQMTSQYNAQYKEAPGRLAKLGFDAALVAVRLHAIAGDDLSAKRPSLARFSGAAGRYQFDADGDNAAVVLARISSRTLVPITRSWNEQAANMKKPE